MIALAEQQWGINQSLLIAFISALASVVAVMIANRGKLRASSSETATQLTGQLLTQLNEVTDTQRKTSDALDNSRALVLKLNEDIYVANRAKTEALEEITELKERIDELERKISALTADNETLNRLIASHWGSSSKRP